MYGASLSIIQQLLRSGANPNYQTVSAQIVLLKDSRTDFCSKKMEGQTPLITAAKSGSVSQAVVAELLANGADPLCRDESGRSALDWGREKDNQHLVKQMRQVRFANNVL